MEFNFPERKRNGIVKKIGISIGAVGVATLAVIVCVNNINSSREPNKQNLSALVEALDIASPPAQVTHKNDRKHPLGDLVITSAVDGCSVTLPLNEFNPGVISAGPDIISSINIATENKGKVEPIGSISDAKQELEQPLLYTCPKG